MSFEQISKYLYEEYFLFNKIITEDELNKLITPQLENSIISYSQNILQSFIHKSFKHESKIDLDHNEKLEFLGDSVLQLIISEILFNRYPEKSEGDLSKLRSAIVNEQSLANLSLLLQLNRFILLGKGEYKEDGSQKSSILANTYESVLGAIYLDFGIDGARNFVLSSLDMYYKKNQTDLLNVSSLDNFDAKTKLQEIVVKKHKVNPEYRCKEIDSNGKKEYHIELVINEKIIDEIIFHSKKKGMQKLAKIVLDKLN